MTLENIEYLEEFIKVDDSLKEKIDKHSKRYHIEGNICAWYANWIDFCSDWCDQLGYTKTEARGILHGGIGEFMILPDKKGIIRFVV